MVANANRHRGATSPGNGYLKRLAGVNGGIEYDQTAFSRASGLSGKGIDGSDGGRGDAPDHGLRAALVDRVEEAQYIHTR